MAAEATRPGVAPISYSEIQTWSTCRQRWHWQYERSIEARNSSPTPTAGSCAHEALRAWMTGDDWRETISLWLAREMLLRNLLPEEGNVYRQIAHDVALIMTRYTTEYARDFEPVVVEQEFEVRIPKTNLYLKGFWDAIVRDGNGHLWLMEHKFVGQFRSEDDIDLDAQIGIYQFAALASGYNVKGIIYNQLANKPPQRPKLNTNGTMSRADIRCDWETYRQALIEYRLDPAEYAEMAIKLRDKVFVKRFFRWRSPQEVQFFIGDLAKRIWDIRRKKKHIYMSESRLHCRSCPYRELCLEKVRGRDVEPIIELQFTGRRSRRDQFEIEEEGFEGASL